MQTSGYKVGNCGLLPGDNLWKCLFPGHEFWKQGLILGHKIWKPAHFQATTYGNFPISGLSDMETFPFLGYQIWKQRALFWVTTITRNKWKNAFFVFIKAQIQK